MSFFQYANAAAVQMASGLIRKTLVCSENMMICRFDLEEGVQIPNHSHPHDQAGYVVSGKIRITVDGKSCDLRAGDSYSAPPNILHSAQALEASVVVDTFYPLRDDYRAIIE